MLQYVFIAIIVLIILKEIYDSYYDTGRKKDEKIKIKKTPPQEPKNYASKSEYIFNNIQEPRFEMDAHPIHMQEQRMQQPRQVQFDKPNPWTRMVESPGHPSQYYIKMNIPSLNDLQNWKKIIPTLDFDPSSGELIIPALDEGTALAIANLILANLHNSISLEDIMSKQLLQISIAKAQAHEIVRNKLREQILSVTHSKLGSKVPSNFEKDLAHEPKVAQETPRKLKEDIEAFDGNDYSYL
jgi:hypothetical protein